MCVDIRQAFPWVPSTCLHVLQHACKLKLSSTKILLIDAVISRVVCWIIERNAAFLYVIRCN